MAIYQRKWIDPSDLMLMQPQARAISAYPKVVPPAVRKVTPNITTAITRCSNIAADGDYVLLPIVSMGAAVQIFNQHLTLPLTVYPFAKDSINQTYVGGPYVIPPKQSTIFCGTLPGNWTTARSAN
jgi:hypothetical protein